MKGFKTFIFSFTLFFAVITSAFAQKTTAEQKTFIEVVSKKYSVPKTYIIALFERAEFIPEVIKRITHPYEKKPWDEYKQFFLTQKRVTNGLVFWENHEDILNQIQKKYGVPPEIIIAILGVETNYGKHIGTFSAFNALNTLAFQYPKRQSFFRRELAHLIWLAHREKMDAIKMKSSYAGALGIPQFMPSTYRYYAVDFENKGKADLLNDSNDAMASVANYFKQHGWKKNQPIAAPLKTQKKIQRRWISKHAKPTASLRIWKKRGITPIGKFNPNQKAALVELTTSQGNPPVYWLTFHNFRVIMKYNPRITYAMAVYQLSQKIKKDYEQYHTH